MRNYFIIITDLDQCVFFVFSFENKCIEQRVERYDVTITLNYNFGAYLNLSISILHVKIAENVDLFILL